MSDPSSAAARQHRPRQRAAARAPRQAAPFSRALPFRVRAAFPRRSGANPPLPARSSRIRRSARQTEYLRRSFNIPPLPAFAPGVSASGTARFSPRRSSCRAARRSPPQRSRPPASNQSAAHTPPECPRVGDISFFQFFVQLIQKLSFLHDRHPPSKAHGRSRRTADTPPDPCYIFPLPAPRSERRPHLAEFAPSVHPSVWPRRR